MSTATFTLVPLALALAGGAAQPTTSNEEKLAAAQALSEAGKEDEAIDLLAGVVHRFVYLKYGLAAVLVFVGAKMMLVDVYKLPVTVSLAVVGTLIGASIAASLLITPKPSAEAGAGRAGDRRGHLQRLRDRQATLRDVVLGE